MYHAIKAVICTLSVSPELDFVLWLTILNTAHSYNGTVDRINGAVEKMSKESEPTTASKLLGRSKVILEVYSGKQP